MYGPIPIKIGAVVDGDSPTCTGYSSYPRQAAAKRGWQQYTNVAVCGQTIHQMLHAGPGLDPMRDSGKASTLVGWGGTNHIISAAPAVVKDRKLSFSVPMLDVPIRDIAVLVREVI
jgi:hypothetical protein